MTEKYSKETSEQIQEDILACVDGFMEKLDVGQIETFKDALCQIIVDRRGKNP